MPIITLPFTADLIAGFSAVAVHASRDKVTPVITGVQLTGTHVIGTDRYTVGRYRHADDDAPVSDESVILTADAVAWITRHKLDRYTPALALTVDDETGTLTLTRTDDGTAYASMTGATMTGNYPPVARLFPQHTTDSADILPIYLGADILAHVVKSAQIIGRAAKAKNQPIRFQFAGSDGYKSSPVYVTVGDRFDGLIQPVLPTRS